MTVSFKERASALVFAVKLKDRVDALHWIPQDVLRCWADEHTRIQGASDPPGLAGSGGVSSLAEG